MNPLEQYPILAALTSSLRRSQQQTIAWAVSGLLHCERRSLPALARQLARRSGIAATSALTRLDRLLHNPRLDDGHLTRALLGVLSQTAQPLIVAVDWTAWRWGLPCLVAAAAVERRAVPVAALVAPRQDPSPLPNAVEDAFLARLLAGLADLGLGAVLVFARGVARARLLQWLHTHARRPEPTIGWLGRLVDRVSVVVGEAPPRRRGAWGWSRDGCLTWGGSGDAQTAPCGWWGVGGWARGGAGPWWLATNLDCTVAALVGLDDAPKLPRPLMRYICQS